MSITRSHIFLKASCPLYFQFGRSTGGYFSLNVSSMRLFSLLHYGFSMSTAKQRSRVVCLFFVYLVGIAFTISIFLRPLDVIHCDHNCVSFSISMHLTCSKMHSTLFYQMRRLVTSFFPHLPVCVPVFSQSHWNLVFPEFIGSRNIRQKY